MTYNKLNIIYLDIKLNSCFESCSNFTKLKALPLDLKLNSRSESGAILILFSFSFGVLMRDSLMIITTSLSYFLFFSHFLFLHLYPPHLVQLHHTLKMLYHSNLGVFFSEQTFFLPPSLPWYIQSPHFHHLRFLWYLSFSFCINIVSLISSSVSSLTSCLSSKGVFSITSLLFWLYHSALLLRLPASSILMASCRSHIIALLFLFTTEYFICWCLSSSEWAEAQCFIIKLFPSNLSAMSKCSTVLSHRLPTSCLLLLPSSFSMIQSRHSSTLRVEVRYGFLL